jgi:acyl-CoA synthetase (NDP forming)
MPVNKPHELHRLFYPKNIAVVGASPKSGFMGQGNNYIQGAVDMNFQGEIYPVHPQAGEVLGFKAYRSVGDIPGDVDLAIFTVPAKAVLQVMEDCAAKRVKFVHLFTAGFSETGRAEFAEIEKKMVEMARKAGIRIVGPNCMGIYSPEGGLSFQPFFPKTPGSVGFFSQSGQLAGYFVMKGTTKALRFSKAVSFGNASDLKAHDFLNYLTQDEKTEVIGSYIEGLSHGREFFEAVKANMGGKPLVILKGGQTEGGGRATQSHTAAIAGSMKIWKAFCRQTGIISVDSLEEMVCTISALQRIPLPASKNVAIVGGAGGGSVTMTDTAEKGGLKVPHLSEKTIEKFSQFIAPQGTSVKNPLDLGGGAYFGGHFPKLIGFLRDDPNIDSLIFLQQIGMFQRMMGADQVDVFIDMTLQVRDQLKKPVFLVMEKDDAFGGEDLVKKAEKKYYEAGFAVFPSFEMAVRVVKNLADYRSFLSSLD